MKITIKGRDIFADKTRIGRIAGHRAGAQYTPYSVRRPSDKYRIVDSKDRVVAEGFAYFQDARKYAISNVEILMNYEHGVISARNKYDLPTDAPSEFERGWRDEVDAICRKTDHTVHIKSMARQVGLA